MRRSMALLRSSEEEASWRTSTVRHAESARDIKTEP